MKFLKRGALVASMAVASVAILAGPASATISPFPYVTTSGTGRSSNISFLGNGGCNLTGIAVTSTSPTTAAVTGYTASGCIGTVTAGRFVSNGSITTDLATRTVTLTFQHLIINILGGNCIYSGTFTGTPNGTNTITVRGRAALVRTVSGVCTSSADAQVTATLPGATIS